MGGRGLSGWWYAGIEPVEGVDDDAMSCATLGRTTWAGDAADSCSAWLRVCQRLSMVVCSRLDTHDGEGRRYYEVVAVAVAVAVAQSYGSLMGLVDRGQAAHGGKRVSASVCTLSLMAPLLSAARA
jgi:hypothetical protein